MTQPFKPFKPDLNKVSKAVKQFVADIAKTEGNKKKIDSDTEFNKLSMYLAGHGNSMNKDDLRNKLSKKSSYIPGSSTIDLDPISEKRILKAITNTNFQQHQILVEKYRYLRNQLNRIPTMMEFAESDSIDPINFMFHVISKKDKETGALQKSFTFSRTYLEFVSSIEKIDKLKNEIYILVEGTL